VEQEILPTEPVVGVLLAGGLSRRMGGGDKSLRLLCGAPLLKHVITRLRPQTDAQVLNANGDPARFQEFDIPVTVDATPNFAGPLAGVLTGMIWTRKNYSQARLIATTPCDTPFFPKNLVAKLYNAISDGEKKIAFAACLGRTHPTFGLWPIDLAQRLDGAIKAGRLRLLDWANEPDAVVVDFPPYTSNNLELDPFFNINYKEDLTTAEHIISTRHCF
jgi:molybdenum cofactor guanylyltransferase